MKISIFVILFLTLAFSSSGQRTDNSNYLYEGISENTFLILSDIGDSTLSKKEKDGFLQEGAIMAFSYWVHTRKGNVSKSKSVDITLKIFYTRIKKINKEHIFDDPLGRNCLAEPERIGISHFSKISSPQYSGYVAEFIHFLRTPREI